MFTNVGVTEMLVIVIVGLVVLGPERLPEAARWIASTIRKVKEFAGDAQKQLKEDFGTDLDEFREPLKQINDLRGMTPRALVTKHLLDGDESLFSDPFAAAAPAGGAAGGQASGGTPSSGAGSHVVDPKPAPQGQASASAAPTPPPTPRGATVWDADAT